MAAFTVINHTELGAGAAELVDVTSIPSSYDHLYAVLSPRGDDAGTIVSFRVQLNGETANTNYSYTNFYTQSATISEEQSTTQPTVAAYPRMPAASATADTFGSTTMWIPNYANTVNFKQALTMNAAENASTSTSAFYLYVIAGLWSNQAAIDRITITASSGNFVQYSTFTLYGVTGA